ncbi:CDGSH iron-sulfur domain-containing protein 2 homolog [Penaeus monodon]|uniref:CDGSH iron-sulfur domain-containing protein 2 homolog n=1 Tax=Penaeus monodon TaxID=6687 RepID=UPI0018A7493B|nr:CDGSH iron-sulfur domain-containing protein 2 homolog [Penaeus monodon]
MDFYKNLTVSDWASLIPFGIACAAVGFGVKTVVDKKIGSPCNPSIRKGESKVVDTVDIEDLGNKAVFCRCWRSSKFPYCDGTHNGHNVACGDNVDPSSLRRRIKGANRSL